MLVLTQCAAVHSVRKIEANNKPGIRRLQSPVGVTFLVTEEEQGPVDLMGGLDRSVFGSR